MREARAIAEGDDGVPGDFFGAVGGQQDAVASLQHEQGAAGREFGREGRIAVEQAPQRGVAAVEVEHGLARRTGVAAPGEQFGEAAFAQGQPGRAAFIGKYTRFDNLAPEYFQNDGY